MMKKPISILLLCGVWPLISSAVDRIHEPGEMAGRGPLTTATRKALETGGV